MRRFLGSCLIVVLALCLTSLTAAARPSAQATGVLTESLAGGDSFERYCAPCHGDTGQGDGPVASALRTRPADLTTLARRSGGAFPRERVRDFITGTGRPVPAHGTIEMPIWGPMFRVFESDARVRERIANLVAYLESIQRPSTSPNDLGSRLFRTHCASCHGVSARGDGPLAEHLRHLPPDLTQFTSRNGGVFPSERVYRIIDGRGVPSHGDREMPVWGDVFQTTGGGSTEGSVKARIEAIVRYLEGIQARAA